MPCLFPEEPQVIEKSGKTYITNMKIMLASDLYSKQGKKVSIKNCDLIPPVGWYASEKWDGIRAIWNGQEFVSRGSGVGNPKVFSYVPKWFQDCLPKDIPLDGELWIGRNCFNEVSSLSNRVPNKKVPAEMIDKIWEKVIYKVFDIPGSKLVFKDRLDLMEKTLNKIKLPNIQLTKQVLIKTENHLNELYLDLTNKGAEGVIIKHPNGLYEEKRSKYMLKYKIHQDAEGVVIGHQEGTGRLKGTLGSLEIKVIKDGKVTELTTNVGTGFLDSQRTLDPENTMFIPVGTIISFGFMEMTKDSVRHPVFRGIREDISIKY